MTNEPGAVVLRTGRPSLLVLLGATGFLLTGILAACASAVAGGGQFRIDGSPSGPTATVLLWLLLVPLALLLTIAVAILLRELVSPTATVLSPTGYQRLRRGRVEFDVRTAELTGVRFRPATRATWSRTDPQDPSMPGVSRGRLHNRIELRAPHGTVEVADSDAWPAVVDIVRAWVRQRPELVDDPASRSFLLDPSATTSGEPEALPRWPLGLVALAVRRRDPWVPFLPDSYGRYSRLFNGRYTGVRAARRGSRLGLAARWAFLALWFVPLVVLAWLIGRALVLLV